MVYLLMFLYYSVMIFLCIVSSLWGGGNSQEEQQQERISLITLCSSSKVYTYYPLGECSEESGRSSGGRHLQ